MANNTPATSAHFEKLKQARAEKLNDEMSKQSSFYEMRARHYAAQLLAHPWMPVNWCFKRAHKAACADYFARTEEAMRMMADMGEVMTMPVSYRLLKGLMTEPVKTTRLEAVNE